MNNKSALSELQISFMSFPPINIPFWEPKHLDSLSPAAVLCNWEPTSACRLTPVCGTACILASTHSAAGPEMPRARMEALIDEMLFGPTAAAFRHILAGAKEPTQAPALMRRFARGWHSLPRSKRALSIGLITASPTGLRELAAMLADTPLTFALISVDSAASGLRTVTNNAALLSAAVEARNIGGIEKFGVNTTIVDPENLTAIEGIGREVQRAGAAQWTLAGFCRPVGGEMRPVLNLDGYNRVIEWVDEKFRDQGLRITLDMPFDIFNSLARSQGFADIGRWRLEHPLLPHLEAQTLAMAPGTFVRVRWDGRMMSLNDIMREGGSDGRYGTYQPGCLSEVAAKLAAERNDIMRSSIPILGDSRLLAA